MGYRSDVRIRTTQKGYEIMKIEVAEYLKKHKEKIEGETYDYNLFNHLSYLSHNENEVTFGWDYIKWYESCNYIDVDAIMYSLGKLQEKEKPYHYIRVGEEYDDIDELYYSSNEYVDSLYLVRQIQDEYPNELQRS